MQKLSKNVLPSLVRLSKEFFKTESLISNESTYMPKKYPSLAFPLPIPNPTLDWEMVEVAALTKESKIFKFQRVVLHKHFRFLKQTNLIQIQ